MAKFDPNPKGGAPFFGGKQGWWNYWWTTYLPLAAEGQSYFDISMSARTMLYDSINIMARLDDLREWLLKDSIIMSVIICCYTIGLLVWFWLLWFDSLWQLPFSAVVVAGFLFSLYFAVRSIRKKKSWTAHLASLIPLGVVVLSVVLLFLPLLDWKVRVDHRLFCSQRMRFIDEVRGQEPLLSGAVKLPHRWLSQDGEAYVFNPEPERLLVGFWVRRGMQSPSWCVVYSGQDTPPTAADLHCDTMEVFSKLSPHWYYLHFD